MYPQSKILAKIRAISKLFIWNYHFYSREILQYIAGTWLRNASLYYQASSHLQGCTVRFETDLVRNRKYRLFSDTAQLDGMQRRMISVDNFFVFLKLLFFDVLLLYVT